MEPTLSTPVRAGAAHGRIMWLVERCTFAARLRFDLPFQDAIGGMVDGGRGVPGELLIGDRRGQFITVDRLVNRLALSGLSLDAGSIEAVLRLRYRVTRTFGDVELVGSGGPVDGEVAMVLPDDRVIELRSELAHPEHRLSWGPASGRAIGTDGDTMATARLLVRAAWSEAWGTGEEMLAQVLAHSFLARCGPEFSLNANALCDWYLVDRDLSTGTPRTRFPDSGAA